MPAFPILYPTKIYFFYIASNVLHCEVFAISVTNNGMSELVSQNSVFL